MLGLLVVGSTAQAPEERMKKLWRWFLARFRLSQKAICEESVGLELHDDYHDYPDSDVCGSTATHFSIYKCRHCGKEFVI
jgi:hypothetical protein